MLTNCCPAAAALTTITAESCAKRLGQVQKIIFQRLMNGSTKNSIADGTSSGQAGLLATWTALKAATDSTKIVVSPFVEAPATDGGDAITTGGGNDSLNGVERVIGSNPVNFSCRLNNKAQAIIADMKKLMCEALGNNLGVYLVNENGQIAGIKDSGSWYPIPVQRLFVGDLHLQGLVEDDYNDLSFGFAPNYSDKLDVLTLDSSALAL